MRRGSRAWPGHLQWGGRPQGQQPPAGTTGCDQAPCKGRPPAGAAARKRATGYGCGANRKVTCEQKHRLLLAVSSQGATSPQPARRGEAPTEAPPASTALAVGAAAGGQGQPRRRRRRGQREG
ncbi:hypothetical protein GW17_00056082 [Ensete ventricosum]|nr:hypothetical protein GW17_00056082 [Ensete ventricosum]RZS22813.1 hypothetical protein BHM03_00055642 [Ensete ventricosum]